MRPRHLALACLAALAPATMPAPARACGCLAPPDPASPVVQAGERIIFASSNSMITAIIQIQYQGDAADFGWLLPLPSLPTLEVSSDEVFASVVGATAPDYETTVHWTDQNCGMLGGGGFDLGTPDLAANSGGPGDPLVLQSSVGPYDYAILKADDKTDMLAWLANNHYLVPTGTDAVLTPYLHPGAFFLALKLMSGKSAGDLQPVVVHYASDLPMIPITLTSVTASQGMNVWAWVLGQGRAIPRNYYQVVLDDAALEWPGVSGGGGTPHNYADVVQAAVKSTMGHHAFVTELAAPTSQWSSRLFPPTRYGDLNQLMTLTDAGDYLRFLKSNGFTFTTQLVALLQKYIPMPMGLQDMFGNRPSVANYYYNFDFWFTRYPQYFQNFSLAFDPVALTSEIQLKVVKPVRDAAALFQQFPYLTRLYTRLNPEDMNADPVFSYNPSLPDVSNVHNSTLTVSCGMNFMPRGTLVTEQGFSVPFSGWGLLEPPGGLPPALRIEVLRESGPPEVQVDNEPTVLQMLGQAPPDGGTSQGPDLGATLDGAANGGEGGSNGLAGVTATSCSVGGRRGGGGFVLAILGALAALALRRGSRRRSPRLRR